MRFLLDTCAFLWWLDEPEFFATKTYAQIQNAGNEVFVSAVSFLEIALKQRLGKLRYLGDLEKFSDENGFINLALSRKHALLVADMPLHHKDPFDRALIAQATIEGLTIVTRDRMFTRYPIPVLIA